MSRNINNKKMRCDNKSTDGKRRFCRSRVPYILAVFLIVCLLPLTSADAAARLTLYSYQWNSKTLTAAITGSLPDTTLFEWNISPELSESYTEAANAINTAEVSEDRKTAADIIRTR